ncbi:MAG: hypothetical protein JWO22_1449 [Frankiales bacterium]|nr:hypothetical protein [Frankiales bacterium]
MFPRPFLLLGQPRAGTVLLGSLLANHPTVAVARDELVVSSRRPHQGLDRARWSRPGRHVGLRLDPSQLARQQASSWLHVAAHRSWLVVHVQRRDTLRHELASRPRPVFDVDPATLLPALRARADRNLQERADLLGVEHLQLSYEDDLDSPAAWQATADRVLASLGLPTVPVSTRLPHRPDRPIEHLVGNAAELLAALR